MKSLKIALLQLLPCKTSQKNLEKGIAACRKAKEMGADIALFPEMWNVGYSIPDDIPLLKSTAVEKDSSFVETFGKLAKELDISRSYLSMILNGTMNSKTIEDKVVNWYKTEKEKGE
jgi:predicted amidohydrolase